MKKNVVLEPKAGVKLTPEAEDRVFDFIGVTSRTDLLFAGALALFAFALLTFWSYPGIHPEYWSWAAIASGTRPPEGPVVDLWALLARGCCRLFGVSAGLVALKVVGHLFAGLLTGVVYLLLRYAFAERLSLYPEELSRCVTRFRLLTAAGTALFVCADPVWRMGQFFSPELLHVVLAALAVVTFLAFRRTGRLSWYCLSYAFLGILAAETPVGLLFAVGFFVANIVGKIRALRVGQARYLDSEIGYGVSEEGLDQGDFDDEAATESARAASSLENWAFCMFFFLSFVGTLLVDAWLFHVLGGMEVKRFGTWDYPMIFVSSWMGSVKDIISFDDFLAAGAFTLVPFLACYLLMPLATDPKSRLAFPLGWLLVALGLGAETQLGPVSRLWYWTWDWGRIATPSGISLTVLSFFGIAALTCALLVVACGCRRRFVGVDTVAVAENAVHSFLRRIGSFLLIAFTVSVLVLSVCGRRQGALRTKLETMNAYVDMQAAHADGTRWMFTDGSFDDIMRVAFREKAQATQPVSVMSGHRPYEAYLRARVAADVEDVPALEASGAEALRLWVNEKNDYLQETAAQTGFSTLFKTRGLRPRTAGTAMRIARTEEEGQAFDRADAATDAFSRQVLSVATRAGGVLSGFDRLVNEKFDFMLWRLARLADQRAIRSSIAHDSEGVRLAHDLSRGLDQANLSLRKLASNLERLKPSENVVLTPRESLMIALKRADFELAHRYAAKVLRQEPKDAEANFAMGMWGLETHDYARAVRCFSVVLEANPKDPTVLNNIALAHLKLNELDPALEYAEQAAALAPDAPEVSRTLEAIREKRANR